MLPSAENAISGAGFGNPALGGDGEWAAVLFLTKCNFQQKVEFLVKVDFC